MLVRTSPLLRTSRRGRRLDRHQDSRLESFRQPLTATPGAWFRICGVVDAAAVYDVAEHLARLSRYVLRFLGDRMVDADLRYKICRYCGHRIRTRERLDPRTTKT